MEVYEAMSRRTWRPADTAALERLKADLAESARQQTPTGAGDGVTVDEWVDRLQRAGRERRLRSVECPRCGAKANRPCRGKAGEDLPTSHAARGATLSKHRST